VKLVAEVIQECHQAGLTLRVADGCIRVRPRSRLTPDLADTIKAYKPEILNALVESSRSPGEEQAMAPDCSRESPDLMPVPEVQTRVQYVTCESCAHWTGGSPCGAGLNTSGDPIPAAAVRICGFHIPKGVRS